MTCAACARGKRVSPGVLACMGSTVDFIEALDHANAHMPLRCPDDVCAANEQRGCVHKLKGTTGSILACIARRRGAHLFPDLPGPFALHDSFHEGPSQCPRAPVTYCPVRGPCGVTTAMMYQACIKYPAGGGGAFSICSKYWYSVLIEQLWSSQTST